MTMTYLPTTKEISALFIEDVRARGWVEPEVYDDGVHVFARAVHRRPLEIRLRDAVRGGVALRVMGDLVDVHPFLLRQVCTNGAIMAEALPSRSVRRVEVPAPSELVTAALDEVRAAIQACGDPAAIADAVGTMRRATQQPVSMTTAMLTRRWDAALVAEMFERFEREQDRSAFGLVNALTSIARDAADPEHRWRIEALGGTLLALISRERKSGSSGALEDALAGEAIA